METLKRIRLSLFQNYIPIGTTNYEEQDSVNSSSGIRIENLVADVCLVILGYLELKDLLSVEQVCKRMRILAQSDILWKSLYERYFSLRNILESDGNQNWKQRFVVAFNARVSCRGYPEKSDIQFGVDVRSLRTLMMGLDHVGKTTILYKIKIGNDIIVTNPTIGFNVEIIGPFEIWDIGGQAMMRPLWHHYFATCDVLIWVVESTGNRIEESKRELHRILKEPELANVPILVFANKCDLFNALPANVIADQLELHKLEHRWYVQPCNTVDDNGNQGLLHGLNSLLPIKQKSSSITHLVKLRSRRPGTIYVCCCIPVRMFD